MSAITAKASRKMKKYAVLTREPRCFLGSFDFSWEQRKVSELFRVTRGYVLAATQTETTKTDEKPYPVYSSQTKDKGLMGYYKDYLYEDAITWTTDGANAGTVNYRAGKFYCTNVCGVLLSNEVKANQMIAEALNSVAKGYVSYVGNPKLMNNVMADIVIQIPTQAEEREQLSSIFAKLDNLITLHQRKCALLFSPFQALISMMFTTSTFSWEQRKAKELFVSTADKGYPELPVLSATQDRGMIRRDENSINIFHDKKNEAGYKRVLPGQFVIHLRSFQGGFAHSAIEGITSPAYTVFGFSEPEKHNSEYWKYVFTSKSFIQRLETVTYGIRDGRSISYEEFLTLGFVYPSKAEQTEIARYLDKLSDLITLHQRKCISFTGRAGRLISTVNKKRITSSWEQRKFGEVFDCTVPNNTLSRAELSYDEGTVLNVHYGDVLIKYGSVLDVQKDDIPRIPHRCREDFNGALLQDGDIIIADTAEDETTGKACEISNLQGSVIVSGLHTMVCRPRNRMALGYLGYYLNSNAYHHQLLPLMQGIKVLSLSRSNIQKTSVSYPTAVKEQQHIAYYFSQLDNLITLHQRKPFLMKWRTSDANRNQTNRLVL